MVKGAAARLVAAAQAEGTLRGTWSRSRCCGGPTAMAMATELGHGGPKEIHRYLRLLAEGLRLG
ncbi:hypothetical protein LT493_44885 [Streptomyces tricolor]|nr:hypothetical protein [Streptomyces tricolor]